MFKKLFGIKKFSGKKVLVLEGGGMRGIFLTGVLQAFSEKKYFPWKLIIGSSAGALVGCAYAAGQIDIARDAFFSKLSGDSFIKLSNILHNEKHILNLDWMIETIIRGNNPLNVEKLKKSVPVLITATDCGYDSAPQTVYLNSKKDDIFTALKATAAIPFLYRGFVEYENYHLLDGGLLDPFPYKKALELGYKEKEILVVLTREKGYRKNEESFWVKALYESYYRDPKLRPLVLSMDNRYNRYNDLVDDLENVRTSIDVIYPPKNFSVNRLTRDRKKILEGFEQGVSAGKNYLMALGG